MPWIREFVRKLLAQFIHLLVESDIELSEFQSCAMATMWGFWLLMKPTHPLSYGSWDILHHYLCYPIPGFIFVVLGLGHLAAIFARNYFFVRFFSMAAVCVWLYAAICLEMFSPGLLLAPTCSLFAIAAAWGYLRVHFMQFKRGSTNDRES